ncbi:AMP-binding protein [Methylosinus sporium]|uniref:AMP-dependent synthetase n=1 Tax=Methylosinus sporium TaxID=428 RepID=A0A2U1SMI9_METSR|nr:AMP-binding protein [Methylosinus sporium]PWB92829.1 hypothetical protein C5689_16160 [Methylosinus sporium]
MNSFYELLVGAADHSPEQEAVISGDASWTYRELKALTDRYVEQFAASGVGRGSTVAVMLENRPEAIALFAACAASGAVFTPIDVHAPDQRRRDLLCDAQPDLVVTDVSCAEFSDGRRGATLVGSELRVAEGGGAPKEARNDGHLYTIYTSGSTGRPKGIMMSEGAALSFFRGLLEFMRLPAGSRYMTTSPLHFDYFWLDVGLTLASGGVLILLDRAQLRKPGAFVAAIERYGAGYVSAVPTIWKMALRFAAADLAELTTLRRIVFAGEHFPQPHIRELYRLIPDLRIVNVYGQSESIACAFHLLPNPLPAGLQHLPVGRGHCEAELFLIDDNGREIREPFRRGELYLEGQLLFSGYSNGRDETAKRLLPDPRSGTGTTFRTGDICYFDDDGVFYFVRRADSQVQVAGNRVEPAEIEAVIGRHEDVNNVAVVAMESEGAITLHAFVVPCVGNGAHDLEERLRSYCAAHLPYYMSPRAYHLVEGIPIGATGKNDVNALRGLLLDGGGERGVCELPAS